MTCAHYNIKIKGNYIERFDVKVQKRKLEDENNQDSVFRQTIDKFKKKYEMHQPNCNAD